MQQASGSISNYTAPSGNPLRPGSDSPRFVVNLCASTTPVGLVQPTHAGLKRFTFFVSRRLEEGRERFRLHMGYFDSQEEAEKILDLVRDVYPAAWAGVAPGIKLRARAAAAADSAAAPVPAPATALAAAPTSAPAPAPVVAAVAAPVAAPIAPVAPVADAVPAAAASSTTTVKLELVPDVPRAMPRLLPELAVPEKPAAAGKPTSDHASADGAARSLSDVRAAIDSLDEVSGDTTVAHVVAPAPAAAPEPPAAQRQARGGDAEPTLEGPAVLRLLESSRPATGAKAKPVVTQQPARSAAVAAPAPTAPRAEPTLFAVQLLWSVQPINMSQIPQLAIFSAYTLYGAEGNRDGRRWYGLRLGFFTDAVSAKQVAQYVRSEFSSVSVVPVSVRERGRASAATSKPLPPPATAKRTGPELNFIEDVHTDTATSGSRPALKLPPESNESKPELAPAVRAAIAAVGISNRPTPGKRAKLRVAQGTKPVGKRPAHKRPLSLEETLEILGAGELQVDNGRGELLNDSSRRERKRAPATPSGSRFGRLINRLAERLGNS
ncbi:MAG: hypothetical protein JSR15_02265 [Proteobacteria bacterium]|nr:hypothetical protein [Pseudomonadota bacterium]